MKTSSLSYFFFIAIFPAYLSVLSLPCQAQWVVEDDLPTPLAMIDPVVWNGKIYVFGGKITGILSSDQILVFNPETDDWSSIGQLPDALEAMAVEEFNGKFYLFGGHSHPDFILRNEVMRFDPATGTFDTVGHMPTARVWFSTVVLDGKIYVMGGENQQAQVLNTVDIFDPESGNWEVGTPMPIAREFLSADTLNGKIYVTGGGASGAVEALKTVEIFDPVSGWQPGVPMINKRGLHGAKTVNGRLYVFGGGKNYLSEPEQNTAEYFDPVLNVWTLYYPMNFSRRELGAAVLEDRKIYAIGGAKSGDGNLEFLAKVEKTEIEVASYEAQVPVGFDPQLRCLPNPFSGQMTISYRLSLAAEVRLAVYNVNNRLVRILSDERQVPGTYTLNFDSGDLPIGLYMCRLQLGEQGEYWMKMVKQ